MLKAALYRLCTVAIALALIGGAPMHAAAAGLMDMQMVDAGGAAHSGMPACDACGDDAMAAADCTAICVNMAAVKPEQTRNLLSLLAGYEPSGVVFSLGRPGSPDPHPPKRPVLA